MQVYLQEGIESAAGKLKMLMWGQPPRLSCRPKRGFFFHETSPHFARGCV